MNRVYDNIFTEAEIKEIYDVTISPDFGYYHRVETYTKDRYDKRLIDKDVSKFSSFEYLAHQIIFKRQSCSNADQISKNILDIITSRTDIKYKTVITSRIHLLLPGKPLIALPHIDLDIPHKVILYYVNTTDGNTMFYDDDLNVTQEVEPVAGRFVIFDGNTLHGNTLPENKHRIVFNFNLE
jgi:hypothetical protein